RPAGVVETTASDRACSSCAGHGRILCLRASSAEPPLAPPMGRADGGKGRCHRKAYGPKPVVLRESNGGQGPFLTLKKPLDGCMGKEMTCSRPLPVLVARGRQASAFKLGAYSVV